MDMGDLYDSQIQEIKKGIFKSIDSSFQETHPDYIKEIQRIDSTHQSTCSQKESLLLQSIQLYHSQYEAHLYSIHCNYKSKQKRLRKYVNRNVNIKRFGLLHSMQNPPQPTIDYDIYFHQMDRRNQWLDYRAVQARGGFPSSLNTIHGAFPEELEMDLSAILQSSHTNEPYKDQHYQIEQ